MQSLVRGQRLKFASFTAAARLDIGLEQSFSPARECDFACFGVDDADQLSDDRYFVFYNQRRSPEGAIELLGQGARATIQVDLARLPSSIKKLVFTATLDAGCMADLRRARFTVCAQGNELAEFVLTGADFSRETAVVLAVIYFVGEWRINAVGQGFSGGLRALLQHFGGIEQTPSPTPAAARHPLGNSGYRYMLPNPDAKTFVPTIGGALPQAVDLRPWTSPIEDQLNTNSCTANAVAGAYEYLFKRQMAEGQHFDVSRLFLYYNARLRDGCEHQDEGSAIQSAMEGAQRFGVCSENTWPFQTRLVLERPSAAAYQEACSLVAGDMEQVPVNEQSWKRALAEGYPIVFGSALFESFDRASQVGGVVRMPGAGEVSRGEHGLHAMLCVGYSDVEQVFIVRNSWGENWGDKGHCYMPYNYLMNPAFNGGDNWILRSTKSIPAPQAAWNNDSRPVVNGGQGVDFVINQVAPVLAVDAFFNVASALSYSLVPAVFANLANAVGGGHWHLLENFSGLSGLLQPDTPLPSGQGLSEIAGEDLGDVLSDGLGELFSGLFD